MTEAEAAAAPEGMQYKRYDRYAGIQIRYHSFRIRLYRMWFLCKRLPGMKSVKAITMQNFEANEAEQAYFDYGCDLFRTKQKLLLNSKKIP